MVGTGIVDLGEARLSKGTAVVVVGSGGTKPRTDLLKKKGDPRAKIPFRDGGGRLLWAPFPNNREFEKCSDGKKK